MHAEVQMVENKIINTTVGRVIFNDALPKNMPFVNGLLKKKGLQQLVQYCYLTSGLRSPSRCSTTSSSWASPTPPAPACRSASTT